MTYYLLTIRSLWNAEYLMAAFCTKISDIGTNILLLHLLINVYIFLSLIFCKFYSKIKQLDIKNLLSVYEWIVSLEFW